jgi:carbon starvation protein CstA
VSTSMRHEGDSVGEVVQQTLQPLRCAEGNQRIIYALLLLLIIVIFTHSVDVINLINFGVITVYKDASN